MSTVIAEHIEIVEVSPRDGLQNESRLFSTAEKLALIESAIASGIRRLEIASFVHPGRVPQMADAEAVISGMLKPDDVTTIGLIMNDRGLDRALETEIDEVGCVCVTTDSFAQENQGQTSDQSVQIAKGLIKRALQNGKRANATISAAFGCPFEGEVSMSRVVEMALDIAGAGPHEISIADTIGVGTPWQVETVFNAVSEALPGMPLRAHFHNTRNTGIANVYAAVRAGVRTIDASLGGMGGCPFAPAATGNVPTEDVLYMLERNGFETGVSMDRLIDGARWLTKTMGHPLPGMVSRAGNFPRSDEKAAE